MNPVLPEIGAARRARLSGRAFALASASLFIASCQKPANKTAEATAEPSGKSAAATAERPAPPRQEVNCLGANECKGKSACHVAGGHACAGQNECKGKGWLRLPRAACDRAGGKPLEG